MCIYIWGWLTGPWYLGAILTLPYYFFFLLDRQFEYDWNAGLTNWIKNFVTFMLNNLVACSLQIIFNIQSFLVNKTSKGRLGARPRYLQLSPILFYFLKIRYTQKNNLLLLPNTAQLNAAQLIDRPLPLLSLKRNRSPIWQSLHIIKNKVVFFLFFYLVEQKNIDGVKI